MIRHNIFRFLLAVAAGTGSQAFPFVPPSIRGGTQLSAQRNPFNAVLTELGDMFSSMDDVIDDFMSKRMGNGEVFYGQRKYKPSGRPNTEGKYNGMGMSDKTKIDVTREYREERRAFLEQKKRQEEHS